MKTFPSDFDIFSWSRIRCSTWTQNRANCFRVAPFGLRNLILMVRENEIDAAGVKVDRRSAEQPQRHG